MGIDEKKLQGSLVFKTTTGNGFQRKALSQNNLFLLSLFFSFHFPVDVFLFCLTLLLQFLQTFILLFSYLQNRTFLTSTLFIFQNLAINMNTSIRAG
jgi:hypothetical protein